VLTAAWPVLSIERLTAGYQGSLVIRDVDITVGPAELVALLGANGAGKTTTMRAVSGLTRPHSGTIRLHGSPLDSIAPARRARLGIAHVPEDKCLFAGLTVAEHLRLHHRGERLDEALVYRYFPALDPLRHRRVGLLSGGEQQMLALGRALARHPKLLLLDELSHGLAPIVVEQLGPVVRRYADESGCAILLVEQHISLALDIADRAYVMSRGRITTHRPASELRADRGLILASYLGEDAVPDAAPPASPG
jgi:branched-chain amino acid transport system ATP-binding protein